MYKIKNRKGDIFRIYWQNKTLRSEPAIQYLANENAERRYTVR